MITNKVFDLQEVPISSIVVSNRARKDLGDLSELTTSIQHEGLMQPILVTTEMKLIAGERRLTACKELQMSHITARICPDVDDDKLMIMEMMENVARKEFVWHELIDLKFKLHKHWKVGDQAWTAKQTAEKLHCSVGLISGELALAEAIAAFPNLRDLPSKNKAREAYKKLCQRASDICSLNNLSDEEKTRLDQLMSGSFDVSSIDSPQKVTMTAMHGDDIPDYSDLLNQAGDGSRCESPSDDAAPSMSASAAPAAPAASYIIKSCQDVIKELPDNSVGFLELDPPYAIDFEATYGRNGKVNVTEEDWTVEQLHTFYLETLPDMYRVMMDCSWALVWTGKEHWTWINEQATAVGFATQQPGVWIKRGGSSNHPPSTMLSMYEQFLLLRKGQASFNTPSFPNVVICDTTHASQKIHQWEKPVELYRDFMQSMGRTNSVMFSMFAGSGNAMVAAALEGMKPVGCDNKQKYIHSFYRRLNSYFIS